MESEVRDLARGFLKLIPLISVGDKFRVAEARLIKPDADCIDGNAYIDSFYLPRLVTNQPAQSHT